MVLSQVVEIFLVALNLCFVNFVKLQKLFQMNTEAQHIKDSEVVWSHNDGSGLSFQLSRDTGEGSLVQGQSGLISKTCCLKSCSVEANERFLDLHIFVPLARSL